MLRVLEKPVATAGLGVACAIALLFLLSSAGPFLANRYSQVPSAGSPYSNSGNQNAVTSTVSSTTMAAVSSNSNSYYINGTPSQALTATTTVSSATTELVSANASPLFAFSPNNLASSEHQTTALDTLAILAVFSLVVALGSMYFVKRMASTESHEKPDLVS